MLNINSTTTLVTVLASPIDVTLKRLLTLRRDQLLSDTDGGYDIGNLVQMIVVEPGDSTIMIETTAGYPVIRSPIFEWAAYHDGWFEAAAILSDDGFGVVLFAPDRSDVNATLLSVLRRQIEQMNLPKN